MQQGILNVSLATMITDTVVAAWHELITPQQASRVRVEYRTFGPNQPVQYLKVWAADAAGQWRPVCNYWTAAEGQRSVQGVAFSAPFYSESFAHLLTALLDNQETYSDVDQQTFVAGLIRIAHDLRLSVVRHFDRRDDFGGWRFAGVADLDLIGRGRTGKCDGVTDDGNF